MKAKLLHLKRFQHRESNGLFSSRNYLDVRKDTIVNIVEKHSGPEKYLLSHRDLFCIAYPSDIELMNVDN